MPEGSNTSTSVMTAENKTTTPIQQGPAATSIDTVNQVSTAIPSAQQSTTQVKTTPATGAAAKSEKDESENLYTVLASLSNFENMGVTRMDTGETFKISCFFIDKFNLNKDYALYFKYGQDIESITISSDMHSFGTRANIILNDLQGALSAILECQLNFYFVVSILNVIDSEVREDGTTIEGGLLYQPYIFEIENVQLASPDNSNNKVYSISLIDIISSTLKRVSYGNLLLEQPDFPNLPNFGEIYKAFIEYAALIIHLLHDKKYKISTDIFLGGTINDDLNTIIKDLVLKDVTVDTSLYELINKVYKMAVRELQVPESFAKKAEVKGMVLTPLFLNNEWEDVEGYYRKAYNDHDSYEMLEKINYEQGSCSSIIAVMFKRGLFLKHLQMPFQLAFCQDEPRIYETINPKTNANGEVDNIEKTFNPINGYTTTSLDNVVEIPIDGSMSGLLWKNIALMSDGAEGSTNALIYYNWILEYFKSGYLNAEDNFLQKKFNKQIKPPVHPLFLAMEKLELVGGDKEKFAKINSVTARLRSSDPVKEAFWYVGRSLKSYIFLNSLFGFKIRGNIVRHPGEIIKINYNSPAENPGAASVSSPFGGLDIIQNGYVLAYITQVIHEFTGGEYSDTIYATKICTIGEKSTEYEKL